MAKASFFHTPYSFAGHHLKTEQSAFMKLRYLTDLLLLSNLVCPVGILLWRLFRKLMFF